MLLVMHVSQRTVTGLNYNIAYAQSAGAIKITLIPIPSFINILTFEKNASIRQLYQR